ncbi:MAG: secretion protein F [Candidatus Choladocola sp.]|nr:secretion protein F [Candidatus Choladocola sp.]
MKRIGRGIEAVGAFLVDRVKLDQPGKGKTELHQELIALAAGKKEAVRNYYIRKISVFLGILTVGIFLTICCFFFFGGEKGTTEMKLLGRPGYGEGDRKEELSVQIEGEEEVQELEITVQERKYTDQEKQEMMAHALEELEALLPGENDSLDEVRGDLVFPKSMENGAVTVSWMTIPYGIIDEDGKLLGSEDENGMLVEIQGTLTCAGMETVHTVYAKVFPPDLPEQERLRQSIRREVELADAQESHTKTLELPEEVDGRALLWQKSSENPFLSILALTMVAAVCIYFQMDNEVHKKAEARKAQLLLDYPDLMWKMTMLLGAGLGIKGTFSRISEEYLRKKAEGSGKFGKGKEKIRYVYEEITYACYEMRSGIPESQAYERFGKRCQLPEYIRIGSVLSQNLKKGAKGLTAMLETEAESSLNDRKNHARKIGEQAGTKLLLPMVLMLGIVLAILMVPAFLSF